MGVSAAHGVARGLRRHHPHIQIGTGLHLTVVHVKAVRKSQRGTLLDAGLYIIGVHGGNLFVGQQNHDHVGLGHSVADFCHLEASFFNLRPRCATFAQTHHHLHATVVQVLCMCVPLAAVTDDGHGFALDQAQVAILVVINFHFFLLVKNQTRRMRSPRPMPLHPVRTVSRMDVRSIASKNASFLEWLPVNSIV